MVERWNIGFNENICHLNMIGNPVGGVRFSNMALFPYPLFHYSIIPTVS